MPYQCVKVLLEIPSTIAQREIWTLEADLKEIEGIDVDLQEPKDIATTAVTVLSIAMPIIGTIATVANDIQSIHEVAKLLYEFVHRHSDQKKPASEVNRSIVVKKKSTDTEIVINNYSVEEIEALLPHLEEL